MINEDNFRVTDILGREDVVALQVWRKTVPGCVEPCQRRPRYLAGNWCLHAVQRPIDELSLQSSSQSSPKDSTNAIQVVADWLLVKDGGLCNAVPKWT